MNFAAKSPHAYAQKCFRTAWTLDYRRLRMVAKRIG